MTNKEAIEMIASIGKYLSSGNPIWKTEPVKEATDMAIEALKANTDGVLCALADRECPFQGKEFAWCLTCPHISEEDRALVKKVIAEPKTGRDCTDFVRWLMDEVMDEENWQMNAVANGEIICRKLKKLGLLDVVDGYYVETQKTGEWVRHELWDAPWYTCSECDFHGRNDYNFCPNCGARMLREDGEE